MAPAGIAREVNASRQTRRTDECQRPGVMSKWDRAQPYNCSEYIIWGVHSIVYVLRTPYNEMGVLHLRSTVLLATYQGAGCSILN